MASLRVVCMSIFALVCAERLPAQTAASVPQPASSQPSSDSHSIALTIPDGTPLQIALDKEVCVQKVGQPIHGHVMQPVYVFDHLVIPVGTAATGRISAIDPVPGRTRTLSALNADFTPDHKLAVVFDELILPFGQPKGPIGPLRFGIGAKAHAENNGIRGGGCFFCILAERE